VDDKLPFEIRWLQAAFLDCSIKLVEENLLCVPAIPSKW